MTYHAYLLRIWQENEGERWCFCLKDARSPLDRHFASLEELMIYLNGAMSNASNLSAYKPHVIKKGR